MFKMFTTGMNTSTQVCWPLVNCVISWQLPSLATRAVDVVAAHQCHERDSDVTSYLHHKQKKNK